MSYTHQIYDERQDAALDTVLERLERRIEWLETLLRAHGMIVSKADL